MKKGLTWHFRFGNVGIVNERKWEMKTLLAALTAALTVVVLVTSPAIAEESTEHLLTRMTWCDQLIAGKGFDNFKLCFASRAKLQERFDTYDEYKAARVKHEKMLLGLLKTIPLDNLTINDVYSIMFTDRIKL